MGSGVRVGSAFILQVLPSPAPGKTRGVGALYPSAYQHLSVQGNLENGFVQPWEESLEDALQTVQLPMGVRVWSGWRWKKMKSRKEIKGFTFMHKPC